ncbi:hypothetical protein COLO4_09976 [Corchorus olitorius]|uniref:Uncharacterized protein n=1 Tax=Corchorus olitorius TaxID=93759 RepID=A0A1R3KAL4_9ROSI|nr:hypothetical protein COLO4_09976 [Corchorus olitorius]
MHRTHATNKFFFTLACPLGGGGGSSDGAMKAFDEDGALGGGGDSVVGAVKAFDKDGALGDTRLNDRAFEASKEDISTWAMLSEVAYTTLIDDKVAITSLIGGMYVGSEEEHHNPNSVISFALVRVHPNEICLS